MANGSDPPVLRYIRKLKAQIDAAGAPDGALLARFVRERDEEAFAILMRRHGPMVLTVCRRILRNVHDADDAFQATFLILVRKAGSLGQPDLLANWLYGVATRTAFKAKTASLRRLRLERSLPAGLFAADGADEQRELRDVLDEELRRLPERYRVPVLLCDLEGRTHQEVAKLLKCPRETITTRLTRARLKLRQRLERRGVVLGVGGVAELVGETALPSGLAKTTIQAALLVAAGKATAAAGLSASAVALMEGMLKTMFITKLKVAAAVVLTVGLLGGGGTALKVRSQTAELDRVQSADPVPLAARQPTAPQNIARIPSTREGTILTLGTELKPGEEVPLNQLIAVDFEDHARRRLESNLSFSLGANGKTLVYETLGGKSPKGAIELADGRYNKATASTAIRMYRRLIVGEKIEVGQLLAILDDRLPRLDVEKMKSKVAEAEADAKSAEKSRDELEQRYNAIVVVRKKGGKLALSDDEIRSAKLGWDRAFYEALAKKESLRATEAELKRAELILQMHEIRSRVRGILRAIHKHPGDAVKSLETVFEIEVAKEPE